MSDSQRKDEAAATTMFVNKEVRASSEQKEINYISGTQLS